MRLTIGASAWLALLSGGTHAAAGEAEFAGRATLGTAERPVTLRLACDPAGPGLAATLTVPRFAELTPHFDFDALEGPGGGTAPLTGIRVSAAGGVRSVRVAASGAVAADPATSFTLTVAGARRSEDPLRGLASAMTETGATLTWTQASPRKADAPFVATFPISDAAAVKAAIGPCLKP